MHYPRILVTGASRGLGAALVRELATRGHKLIAAARSLPELEALAGSVSPAAAANIAVVPCNLADPAAPVRLAAEAIACWGGVDVLINNAGIGSYQPLGDWSEADIQDCVQVNLTAPMLLTRALLPAMVQRQHGYVINIASDLARRPLANMAPYVATKHGLLGFTASLLRECKGQGIKATTVMPGIIDTAFNGATEGSKDETWALRPVALACQIADLLQLPEHMVVDELTVHPMQQEF